MKTIRIGRSHTNECILTHPSVSGNHAVLVLDSEVLQGTLKDLNSTNGTFVNNKKISEARVSFTDTVRFGTEVMTVKEIVSKAGRSREQINIPLHAECKTIGKGADNQIRFTQDDVSRKHALLYKTPSGDILIEDCGSTNGTYVNGIKVQRQILRSGDKVTITRNYPLNWETCFHVEHQTVSRSSNWAVAVVAVILLGVLGSAGYLYWKEFASWDKERIYTRYNTSVCWVYAEYGYRIMLNGEDVTSGICQMCDLTPAKHLYLNDGKLASGVQAAQGTAFFISEDGMLATNLHLASPWLYSSDAEKLEQFINKIISQLSVSNPNLSRSKVEVIGELTDLFIIPNGLPISSNNMVKCSVKRASDDIDKDVAILQTDTRSLPVPVKQIIDIKEADASDEAVKEGRPLYTIGFPYGVDIALNDNRELKNQVHGGAVTQNRGDNEFGHDVATAGGASGSPILNDKGRLVGIHHAGMTGVTGAQGFNMAMKVKCILDLLK